MHLLGSDDTTAGFVPNSRNLVAGAGLTGGGDLSADRTFNVAANVDGSIVVNADDIQVGVLASDAQHGTRGGGTQHAVATVATAGFMSAADKSKLDGLSGPYVPESRTVTAGAGLTGGGDLSANRTFNVAANVDGSIVVNADDIQVGVLASDAQHGARGGGTQHAVATGATAGFMSSTDKTKLDGIASGATNDHSALTNLDQAGDHTWAALVDGTRAITGTQEFQAHIDMSAASPNFTMGDGAGVVDTIYKKSVAGSVNHHYEVNSGAGLNPHWIVKFTETDHDLSFLRRNNDGTAKSIPLRLDWSDEQVYVTELNVSGNLDLEGELQIGGGEALNSTSAIRAVGTSGKVSFGDNVTDATTKTTRIGSFHYTNSQAPMGLLHAYSDANDNVLNIGGGTSALNAAEYVQIYTAANQTTLAGTNRAYWNGSGKFFQVGAAEFQANVDLNSANPTLFIGDGTGTSTIDMDKAAGSECRIRFLDAGVPRYATLLRNSEQLGFARYNASGVFQDYALNLEEDGDAVFANNVTLDSASPIFIVGNGTGSPDIVIDRVSTGAGEIRWNESGSSRWLLKYDNGDALRFGRYDGAGSFQDWPLSFDFATGDSIFVNEIRGQSGVILDELAASPTVAAGEGIFWVANTAPTLPKFTDDAGSKFTLAYTAVAWELVFNGEDIIAAVTDPAGTATLNNHKYWIYEDGGVGPEGNAEIHSYLPDLYAGNGLTISLTYAGSAANGSANGVTWTVAFENDEGQSLSSDSFASAVSYDDTNGPNATANIADTIEFNVTDGAQIDNLGAGEPFRMRISRDGADANDTYAGDCRLIRIAIREAV